MAKESNRLAGSFQTAESDGTLPAFLAEEEEFDRPTLWRLGTWAAVSVGSVIIALLASQSSIGIRRDLTASADLVRQAQQMQLSAKDSLAETKQLVSAVETLNGDRDRLYSRVAVLEQGLDSVTGTIARQNSAPSPAPPNAAPASAAPAASSSAAPPAPAAVAIAPAPPAPPAAADPTPSASKQAVTSPAPAPVVAPAVATQAAATEKPGPKPAGPEPNAQTSVAAPAPPVPVQPVASLVAPKSMIGPPDPAATKLIEPVVMPPKTVTSAPIPDVTAAIAKASEDETVLEASPAAPEFAVKRTEFGVDVGGANSFPGLRALWRGLLKSKASAALATLRPIIVIKENSNGLGMQLRLVAGPIIDAAAAARICATLTASDRSCTTTVYEGQRLTLTPDEQGKADAAPAADTASAALDAKPADARPAPKASFQRRYAGRRSPKEELPRAEQSPTMSLIFGRR